MIELYTGTPGSGKSLHCAEEIYKKLTRRKNVIANFDINMTVFAKKKKVGLFLYLDNSDINPELLMDLALSYHSRNTSGNIIEGQTLLVLDECQILFNCREWQAQDRIKWATFFTQHRKYGYNIILITQFDRLIDRQIRSVVEYQVIHRKISNFKTIGFFLGLAFRGNIFVAVTQWYGVKEKIDSHMFVLRPKYARLYDSYRIFGSTTAPAGAGVPGSAVLEPKKGKQSRQPSHDRAKKTKEKKNPECQSSPYSSLEQFWTSRSESEAAPMNNSPAADSPPAFVGYRASGH